MNIILAANSVQAIKFARKHNMDARDYLVVYSIRTLEGLRFRYEDIIRAPGWSQNPEIEEIEDRILRTHIIMAAGTEWDIDANLPTYTRDFLKLIKEGKLDNICTYGTATH